MTLFSDLFQSLGRMPVWVLVWMGAMLIPVNAATILFWSEPGGALIAFLSVGGLAVNSAIMLVQRGMGKLLAVPHLVLWTPAVIYALWLLATAELSPTYVWFLVLYVAVNGVSLAFDVNDARLWWAGERGVP